MRLLGEATERRSVPTGATPSVEVVPAQTAVEARQAIEDRRGEELLDFVPQADQDISEVKRIAREAGNGELLLQAVDRKIRLEGHRLRVREFVARLRGELQSGGTVSIDNRQVHFSSMSPEERRRAEEHYMRVLGYEKRPQPEPAGALPPAPSSGEGS